MRTTIVALIIALIFSFHGCDAIPALATEGRCPQYEQLLTTYNPVGASATSGAPATGWDVDWMSRRMWIESKCDPNASNGTHQGLLQIASSWRRKLTNFLDIPVTNANLREPELNVLVASVLFQWQVQHGRDPYQPWGGR